MNEKHREYAQIVDQVLDPTGQRTSKLCVSPFSYDRSLRNEMEELTGAYARLLEFVFRSFPTSARIQEVLEYPAELESFLGALNIYPKNLAAARIDVFLTSEGFRMVESNTEIPGGNEESYFLENEYLRIYRPEGLSAVPRMEIVFDTLMSHYRTQAEFFNLPQKDSLVIYLCQWQSEIERIRGEYDVLINFIRECGHVADVVDPNRIKISDGKAFAPDGQRIDLIYRRFTSDELPRFAQRKWQMAIDWDHAAVAVVNPFCTKRVDSKNIMVLFKDESYEEVFPADLREDLETVRRIIPWTKKVKDRLVLKDGREVDAGPFLVAEKDSLVIKHANAYSSSAVFIGEDISVPEWRDIVDESLKGDWVVQEKIELPEMDMEYWEDEQLKTARCIYNVNPYIYDGRFGGFLNRASTDKLTSFTKGEIAAVVPCFERNS
ncbi:MAG: hypothetical protein K8R59_04605 [Thermoanaerobaculales bacterium]|nr:hypothetical protein [Thermoanaerobaculales bacterium]